MGKMKRAALAAAMTLAICQAGADVRLAAGKIDVVISGEACPTVRFAAGELTNFLSRATGRAVPVVGAPMPGRTAILLGEAADIATDALARDAFVVKVGGGRIAIAGRDDPKKDPVRMIRDGHDGRFERGTLFGAYDFLEREIGCRFYFPGELGECVPEFAEIAVKEGERTVAPRFRVRRWYNGSNAKWFEGGKDEKTLRGRIDRFNMIRLRMETESVPCCHGQNAFQYVKRFGKSHPEYFMKMKDGTRFNHAIAPGCSHFGQICYSSGAMEELYQDVKAYLTGKPASSRGLERWGYNCVGGKYVDIMANDAFFACLCGKCGPRERKEYGNQFASEMVWGETAKLANRLTAEGVSGYVTQMAYSPYRRIPEIDIPSNVLVMVAERGPWAKSDPKGMARDNAEIRGWAEKLGRPVWIWTYPGKYGKQEFPGIPNLTPRAIGEYYKTVAPWIFGSFMESETDAYLYNHLNYYMLSRVSWDAEIDVAAVLDEYYRLMYGPAAAVAKTFFEALESKWVYGIVEKVVDSNIGPKVIPPPEAEIWARLYTPEFLSSARKSFEPFAAGDSLHARRVRLVLENFLKPLETQSASFTERMAKVAALKYAAADGKPMALVPFKLEKGSDEVRTEATIQREADELVVRYTCWEPRMEAAHCLPAGRNDSGMMWRNNGVEFFLNVSGDRKTYYQFVVAMNGEMDDFRTIQTGSGKNFPECDIAWNSGAKVTPGRFDGGYTLEVRIPVASFGEPVKPQFPANFGRDRVLSGEKYSYDIYTWSPFIVGYHDPVGFGTVDPAPAAEAAVPTLPDEPEYAFRKRLLVVHEPGRRDPATKPEPDEFVFGDGSRVAVPKDAPPLVARAAWDFADYLAVSMDVATGTVDAVTIAIDPSMEKGSYEVDVGSKVAVRAVDARAAAQALYHLEDVMNLRGGPFLRKGHTRRKMRFSPRMVHSGYECDEFPDEHLRVLAHHGMDAILIFLYKPGVAKLHHKDNVADTIRRAKAWGLDTYIYSHVSGWKHPDDPDAEAFFDERYGKLAAAYPEAKGFVVVDENCRFPSKDPRVADWDFERRCKKDPKDPRPAPGYFPSSDYPAWFQRVQTALHKANPNLELVFWAYAFVWQPIGNATAFVDVLPKDVTLNVTFEMGGAHEKRNGMRSVVEDYSLSYAGPGEFFRSMAARAKKDGLRLYTMANSAGLAWDWGTVPFEPCPYQWKRRWDGVVAAHGDYGVTGVMESHHYGVWPSFITELEKEAYTEGGMPFDWHIRKIAERDYGRRNADAALAAWHGFSDAVRDMPPTYENQYGPFRMGPAFPFNAFGPELKHADFPIPPMYLGRYYNELRSRFYNKNDWLGETHDSPEYLTRELELFKGIAERFLAGAATFRGFAAQADLGTARREKALRMADLAEYMGRGALTAMHTRDAVIQEHRVKVLGVSGAAESQARARVQKLAEAEYANTKAALQIMKRNSRLGWEPTMEYRGGVRTVEWKLERMRRIYGLSDDPKPMAFRDKIAVWGYVLDKTPTACPYMIGKTEYSLERAAREFGAGAAMYMNSLFNRDYVAKHFSHWDRECLENCIDNRLSNSQLEKLRDVPEVWCAATHGRRLESAVQIAMASLRHRNIVGVNFDDFGMASAAEETVPQIRAIRTAMHAINPKLKISVVSYAKDSANYSIDLSPFRGEIDHVSRWKWVTDTNYWHNLRADIAVLRNQVGPQAKIVQGLYFHDFSASVAKGTAPLPLDYLKLSVSMALDAVADGTLDGVILPQVAWYSDPSHREHYEWLREKIRSLGK